MRNGTSIGVPNDRWGAEPWQAIVYSFAETGSQKNIM